MCYSEKQENDCDNKGSTAERDGRRKQEELGISTGNSEKQRSAVPTEPPPKGRKSWPVDLNHPGPAGGALDFMLQ